MIILPYRIGEPSLIMEQSGLYLKEVFNNV